MQLQYLKGQ